MDNKNSLSKNKSLIILSALLFIILTIENYVFNSRHPELSMDSIFINPLLITVLFLYITDITNPNHNVTSMLLSFQVIFLVNTEIKQNIYVNSFGTFILIILAISLLYYASLTKRIKDPHNKINYLISYPCLIILCLLEHSLALATIIGILLIYITNKDKSLKKYLLIDIVVSTITLIASKYYQYISLKAISYSSEWSQLSLWKKFASGYDSFFLPMFKYNSLTIIILSTCLIILLLRKNTNMVLKYISIVINIISILLLIISLFIELPWYIEYLFWPIYILINFITLIKVPDNKIALLFYVVAGLSALFICFNEQHELYYSIYTVYYTIIVANVVINEANSQVLIN